MSKKKQKPLVYIYGTGWGSTVAELLCEQGYKVVGMWSYDEDELEKICSKLDIEHQTTDKDELCRIQTAEKSKGRDEHSEDIVWIATPPFQLSYIARQILELSNNVVVEAPGATSVSEVEDLEASASKYTLYMCTCPYQLRNLPAVKKLKKIIFNKTLGAVKSLEVRIKCNQTVMCGKHYNWKYDKNRSGGALNMFGCHIIDLLAFLTGRKVDSVQGMQKNFVQQDSHINGFRSITADDVCSFQLLFKSNLNKDAVLANDVVAWVHISMLYPDTVFNQEVTVLTENAMLVLDNISLNITPYTSTKDSVEELCLEDLKNPQFTCSGLSPGAPLPYILGLKYFISSLDIGTLFHDEEAKTRLESLRHIMMVLETIRKSSADRDSSWLSVATKSTRVEGGYKNRDGKFGTSIKGSKGKTSTSSYPS